MNIAPVNSNSELDVLQHLMDSIGFKSIALEEEETGRDNPIAKQIHESEALTREIAKKHFRDDPSPYDEKDLGSISKKHRIVSVQPTGRNSAASRESANPTSSESPFPELFSPALFCSKTGKHFRETPFCADLSEFSKKHRFVPSSEDRITSAASSILRSSTTSLGSNESPFPDLFSPVQFINPLEEIKE